MAFQTNFKVILVISDDVRFETRDELALQAVQDAVLRETADEAMIASQRWRVLHDMFREKYAMPEEVVSHETT